MQIYALLVGIDEYPVRPLAQCVNDAKKMKTYLESLPEGVEVATKTILNKEATKAAIEVAIKDHLGKAGDDDVALFYYSGHGAQEISAGRFRDEHDGLLECLVSCPAEGQESGYLLADKELRYLFSQLPNNPHLVTIFDSCHAGDSVRSVGAEATTSGQKKRLAGKFPARNYDEFIFSNVVTEAQLKSSHLIDHFPFKNSVHIAACSARELSWEDENGGVFTRYLLQLLEATQGQINYLEIARWANISLKDITDKKQSPTISVQGEGELTAYSPWLKMDAGDGAKNNQYIVYNADKGWYLNVGSILGIKPGALITVDPDGKAMVAKVKETGFDAALIDLPEIDGEGLDHSLRYPVSLNTSHATLRLYVNNVDGLEEDQQRVAKLIDDYPGVEAGTMNNAEFFVNIFNEFVYLSRYNDPFRPLAKQISLLEEADELENLLEFQLTYLVKWHYFDTLVNTDNTFDTPPIKVEMTLLEKEEWHDVTNGTFTMDPRKERAPRPDLGNPWAEVCQVRVTNLTGAPLYVGVLSLGADLEISAGGYDNQVVELGAGESKTMYDHKDGVLSVLLNDYQEVYNWERSWLKLKFIVNNFENFTTSLPDYLQPAQDRPLVLSRKDPKLMRSAEKEMGRNIFSSFTKRWGTLSTTVELRNPTYNVVSGDLATLWDHYVEREELAPFINQLYLQSSVEGLFIKGEGQPTRTGEDAVPRGLFGKIKVGLANFLDNKRRKRKFKRALRAMPDKPVLVAEGDSWFLYPFLVKDILDYVMEEFPVLSIASAGDELENYREDGHLLKSVAKHRPKYVLISGGGNDIIGPEIEHLLRDGVPAGRSAEEYLNEKAEANQAKLKELYEFFVRELKNFESVKQVFLHGYDYIRIDHEEKVVKKGWVNKYMLAKGIAEAEDRDKIIRLLLDTFNENLRKLAEDDPFVTYLDLRGKVNKGQWYDEIHPNDEGYGTVGGIFIDRINEFQAKLP